MRKTLFYLLALLVLTALVAGGLKLRQQRQQKLVQAQPPVAAPWAVQVAAVTRGRATEGFPTLALVEGENDISVASRLGGIILEMGPREGQRVAQGDLLARIDTRELEDKLASLQAQLAAAVADAERKARDAERADELLKDRGISESQADQERAMAHAAREQAHSLEKQIGAEQTRLGYARVTAPFAGVIAERLADPGDLASLGKSLYRLIATDSARLVVRLPAQILEQVRPGAEVEISHQGRILALHADRIFPSLDQRAMGRLEIDVPELPPGTAPGALLRARVITRALDDALLVPADTLLPGSDPMQSHVLRLNTDEPPRIETVPVTIRLRTATGIAVGGNLKPGDGLVRAHETTLLRLRDGDRVRVEGAGQ